MAAIAFLMARAAMLDAGSDVLKKNSIICGMSSSGPVETCVVCVWSKKGMLCRDIRCRGGRLSGGRLPKIAVE